MTMQSSCQIGLRKLNNGVNGLNMPWFNKCFSSTTWSHTEDVNKLKNPDSRSKQVKNRLDKLYGAGKYRKEEMAATSNDGPKKVWTSLITNTKYLSGLITLDYSLKKSGTKYPLVALYTDEFPEEGKKALEARKIPARRIEYLMPSVPKEYASDPRFYDCWSKLVPFSLIEYDRVVQLDSDMLVMKNMDELMELELDPPSMGGSGNRVFAASHACACNPLKKPHYPKDWVPENCAFTSQHGDADKAQKEGPSCTAGIGCPNGGLQVVNPSKGTYDKILDTLKNSDLTDSYDFADQSLLGERFYGRWVTIPYIYNALKTLRWKGVHDAIWRDDEVKNIHYILSPKPWDETLETAAEESHKWWINVNAERVAENKSKGIEDGF